LWRSLPATRRTGPILPLPRSTKAIMRAETRRILGVSARSRGGVEGSCDRATPWPSRRRRSSLPGRQRDLAAVLPTIILSRWYTVT
jgi:hypothetical protein